MLRHVYLFLLKDKDKREEIREKLMTLQEKIPCIKEIEVGFDFRGAESSWDLIEICSFEKYEDFQRFSENPYHEEIRAYMQERQKDGIKIVYLRKACFCAN